MDVQGLLKAFGIQRQAAQLLPLVHQLQQQKRNAALLKALQGHGYAPKFFHQLGSPILPQASIGLQPYLPVPPPRPLAPPMIPTPSIPAVPTMVPVPSAAPVPPTMAPMVPMVSTPYIPPLSAGYCQDYTNEDLMASCCQGVDWAKAPCSGRVHSHPAYSLQEHEHHHYSPRQAYSVNQPHPAYTVSSAKRPTCQYTMVNNTAPHRNNTPANLYPYQQPAQNRAYTQSQARRRTPVHESFSARPSGKQQDFYSPQQSFPIQPQAAATSESGNRDLITLCTAEDQRRMMNSDRRPGCNPRVVHKDPVAKGVLFENMQYGFSEPEPPRPRLSLKPAPVGYEKDTFNKADRGKKKMNVHAPAFTPLSMKQSTRDRNTAKAADERKKVLVVEKSQIERKEQQEDRQETKYKKSKYSKVNWNSCGNMSFTEKMAELSKEFASLVPRASDDGEEPREIFLESNQIEQQAPVKEDFTADAYGFFASPEVAAGDPLCEALEAEIPLEEVDCENNFTDVNSEQDSKDENHILFDERPEIDEQNDSEKAKKATESKVDQTQLSALIQDTLEKDPLRQLDLSTEASAPLSPTKSEKQDYKTNNTKVKDFLPEKEKDGEEYSLSELYDVCLDITRSKPLNTADKDVLAISPCEAKKEAVTMKTFDSKSTQTDLELLPACCKHCQSKAQSAGVLSEEVKKMLLSWEFPASLKLDLPKNN